MASLENAPNAPALPICSAEERPQKCMVIKRPPRCNSLGTPQRLCKTHGEWMPTNSDERAWDAWERIALRKERQQLASERGSTYTRYSRGPDILKALEKLRSRPHS